MMRYHCQGSVVQEPTGGYVTWSDIQALETDVHDFVANVLELVVSGDMTQEDGLKALRSFFRMTLA